MMERTEILLNLTLNSFHYCFLISVQLKRSSSKFLKKQYFSVRREQIVKEKDRFRKAPPNYAMKKTQLLKEKVMLGED